MLNNKILLSNHTINADMVKISFLIFILFFIDLFILNSILLTDYLDFENSFKLSISTLTNTASSSIFGLQEIKFTDLFLFSKISLIVFMIIAKVVVLAVLILLKKLFSKINLCLK